MAYFPLLYRLDGEDRYLTWISGDRDSVLMDAEGFVPTFKNRSLLRRYTKLNHYKLESERPRLHDLDAVSKWIKSAVKPINCKKGLAAWNLFVDVANWAGSRASAFKRLDSQNGEIYNKLFWGNNLSPVTPKGHRYVPEWSPDETAYLKKILSCGLKLFASRTRCWPAK